MLALGTILLVITGFLALNLISVRFTLTEKAGLAFPVGIGIQTLMMAVINLFGIQLTMTSVLVTASLLILAFFFLLYPRKDEIMTHYKGAFGVKPSGYNLVWLFFMALIVFIEYMNFSKCMYFPTFDRDSLAGFDTIGYVIAQEHTLKGLSLFQSDYMPQIHQAGSYIVYAPMVQLSYAFVYIMGAETSKLIPALMYLSFLIAFYGSMKRVISKTGAAVATFFMMITPDMLSFSSMSATNVIHAVSASLGIIYVALWFKYREKKDLYLASLLLGLNIWTRTDGIVFILAALFVVSVDAIKGKRWQNVLVLTSSLIPALLWIVFTKTSDMYAESIAILHPYWDAAKAGTIWEYMKLHYSNTLHYGWTFVFFLISFVISGWHLIKKREHIALLGMMILSSFLYMMALYQIDYKWDSIQNVLAYSAKRFLFCFIPMAWFYSMSVTWVKLLFDRLEAFLALKK
jgi:hypothetical protein